MADTDRLQLENGDILQLEDASGGILIERVHGSSTLTLAGQAITVTTTTSARLTQAGDLVLSEGSPSSVRVTQNGILVLWRELARQPGAGSITLVGQAPTLRTSVAVPSGLIELIGQIGTTSPSSATITLVGSSPTLAISVRVPSGTITLVGSTPTAVGVTSVLLTQSGDLVLAQATDRSVLLTQSGDLVAATSDPFVNLSQSGTLVLYISGREVEPEIATSFGPLVWVEWTGSDGSLPVWAPVDLPDPSTYYRGFKIAKLLTPGVVQRSLSDESGEMQSQRFTAEIDDCDQSLRTLLGQSDARRHLVNTLMVMRMISDEDRRLLRVPRTVAIGVVRSYELS